MSGHSHAKTVKRKKDADAAQRSKIFAKIARELIIAVKEGKSGDPVANSRLRQALEKAREVNMPSDNIERTIKRATGEDGGEQLEEFLFDAYGPGTTALLITGITDNKNRSLGEIRLILDRNGGKLVEEGAVRWMFERKGLIALAPEQETSGEELELAAIEAGAEDVSWNEGVLEITTQPTDLAAVREKLEQRGLAVASAQLDWAPKEPVSLSPEDIEKLGRLLEALDENDAVQDVYANTTW